MSFGVCSCGKSFENVQDYAAHHDIIDHDTESLKNVVFELPVGTKTIKLSRNLAGFLLLETFGEGGVSSIYTVYDDRI